MLKFVTYQNLSLIVMKAHLENVILTGVLSNDGFEILPAWGS